MCNLTLPEPGFIHLELEIMALAEGKNTGAVQANRRQPTTQMVAIFSGHPGPWDLISIGVAGALTHRNPESFILYASHGIGPLHMVLSVSPTDCIHVKTDPKRKTKPSFSPILDRLRDM